MKKNVGFIGLGQMGKWMACNLARNGFNLVVFDIDADAMAYLIDHGAAKAGSPREVAARSDLVFLSLPNADINENVIFGENGVVQGARPGLILVDCGTSGYLWTQKTADSLTPYDILMLDAPVTGLEQKAKEAALTVMVGGPHEQFEIIKPALMAMGNDIIYMGGVGSGQLAKMINNVIYNANIAVLSEMLPLAVKLGLAPEKIGDVINSGSGRSFASRFFIPKILENRFKDTYSLANAYKDMQHMDEAASRCRVTLPLFQSVSGIYRKALDSGLGNQDKSAMIKVFEKEMGVLYRNEHEK